MNLLYIYAKVFKKFLRGKAIYNSMVDTTTKVNSGCSICNCKIGRYNNIGYDNELNNVEIGSFVALVTMFSSVEMNIRWNGSAHRQCSRV